MAKYDVFLSHNSVDKPAVSVIADRLLAEGLRPFLDKWHLIPGVPWQEALAQALADSNTVAIFFGPAGASPWHSEEMWVAINKAVRSRNEYRVIPVLLPGAQPEAISDFLAQRTWVDFRAGLEDDEAFRRLKAGIKGEAFSPGSFSLPDEPAPYRSLEPFETEHARFFFGRQQDCEKLVEMVAEESFVAVVGSSGSGKSSLVRAGLFPALEKNVLPASQHWRRLICRPGREPLRALAEQVALLLPQGNRLKQVDELVQRLSHRGDGFRTAVSTYLADSPQPVLLVVDQFEELFTYGEGEESDPGQTQAVPFINNLAEAVNNGHGCIKVLITLRADFLARALEISALRDLLQDRQLLLGWLDEAALREVIVRPAQAVAAIFEKGLVDLILRDVARQPGSLPLLQYALYELWLARRGPWLTIEAYEASGGVWGALRKRAEITYKYLNSEQQHLARNIFLRLVNPSEGGNYNRRRVVRAELYPVGVKKSEVDELVRALSDKKARLIVAGEQTVEITHEALIQHWERLRGWLKEEQEALYIRRRLTESAGEWLAHPQDPSYLYRGAVLAVAREWAEAHPDVVTQLEQNFLQRSIEVEEADRRKALADARRMAEQAKTLLETEQKLRRAADLRAVEREETNRRLRRRAVLLALIAFVAVIAAGLAIIQWRLVQRQAEVALSRQLAAQAYNHFDDQFDLAILLALAANHFADTVEARGSLLDALEHRPRPEIFLRGHAGEVRSVAFSSDSRIVASAGQDSTVRLWDEATGQEIGRMGGHTAGVWSVLFSPDGTLLASAGNDRTIILTDAATCQELGRLVGHHGPIYSLAFSPDGKILASGSADKSIILWDVVRQTSLKQLLPADDSAAEIYSVAISPDGRLLAAGRQDHTIGLWDIKQGQFIGPLWEGHRGGVESVAFSPDGRLLASASEDKQVGLWDVTSRNLLTMLVGHQDEVLSVAFSPDGQTLASAGKDKQIILWQVASGQPLEQLASHTDQVGSVAFSPDGRKLASASRDKSVILWDMTGVITGFPEPALGTVALPPEAGPVRSFTLGPAGRMIASTNSTDLFLWDLQTGQSLGHLSIPLSDEAELAFTPDGRLLAAIGAAYQPILWDVSKLAKLDKLGDFSGQVRRLAVSPTAQLLALGANDPLSPLIILWDLQADREVGRLVGHSDRIDSLAFSPNGKLLASASCGQLDENRFCGQDEIVLWEINSRQSFPFPPAHRSEVTSLAFGPQQDTQILASASRDGTIGLWDVDRRRLSQLLDAHRGPVNDLSFSPDGQQLVSANDDGTTILWDVATGRAIGQPWRGHHNEPVREVAFSPVNGTLYSGGDDGAVVRWDLSYESWVGRACKIAGRNLSHIEWSSYVGTDLPFVIMGSNIRYVPLCPNLSAGAGIEVSQ